MSVHDLMNQWLSSHPPEPKDSSGSEPQKKLGMSVKQIRKMDPQREIDLHGFTALEGEKLLESFLDRAVKDGLRKVLIIHGKGFHSEGEPVIKLMVSKVLTRRAEVGETGFAQRAQGGTGATWAVLHQRSR